MKRCFFWMVFLALLFTGAGKSSAGPVDYVYLTNGEFGTTDLQNGSFTLIGPASTEYEDLTRLPGGVLYGANGSSQLLIINQITGAISSVVGNMGNDIFAVKFSGSGALFGTSATDLYTINKSNANPTLVGAFGIANSGVFDVTFNGNKMYLQETNGAGGISNLYTVNTSTGVATLVGNVGYALWALDFEGSTLYGFTQGGQIVSIDTTSGAGTFLANESSGIVLAATTAAAVPEPAALTLFAIGIGSAGIAACCRRRKSAVA
jgi:PEP-CTERM motif